MTEQQKIQVPNRELHAITRGGDSDPSRTAGTARRSNGHSLVELLIVVAMIGILVSLALPQMIANRRLSRSVGVTREILTQLRQARQLAMSQRQAFTFQYDDVTKQISIIDHNSNPGPTLLSDPSYPNTAGSKVVGVTPLASETLSGSEMSYGIPAGLPTAPLGDGIPMTALLSNRLNITFQPDGSVIDATGNPVGRAMFIYNSKAPQGTASAISIMGASGRVKIWRYDSGANLYAD
jgi:prepilin-type N-terminal cleavage/methylation domain-containing protein